MKIDDLHTDMESIEGLYTIDEYDYTEGMLLTEGYARTYSFRYPKGPDRDVHDENPTVIVLCTYKHPNGNMHLAGININVMKGVLDRAEELIARAESTTDPEQKRKILNRGNYQLSRYEEMQRGLQDILSYDVEVEEADETGNMVKSTKRRPRPCRSIEGAQGRYAQGKNSESEIVRTLFANYYRTYNMANIIGGREAMMPGTVSFVPKAEAERKKKEAAKIRREKAKKEKEEARRREEEERERQAAELAKELEPEAEPEPEVEEPRLPEEEEYSEEFLRELDGILIE
jgi:hypothetical protein